MEKLFCCYVDNNQVAAAAGVYMFFFSNFAIVNPYFHMHVHNACKRWTYE